ncbi:MAG: hypothetical protein J7J38_00485 [Candidatus Aenigmarchaeota archaeon]|nr:hypothetical protein [Candidatus Aenigmarchaeota archaeon]
MEIRSRRFKMSDASEMSALEETERNVEKYLISNGKHLRTVFDHLSRAGFATGLKIYQLGNDEKPVYVGVTKAVGIDWDGKPSMALILTIPEHHSNHGEDLKNVVGDGAELRSGEEMIDYEQLKYLADGGKPSVYRFA